MLGEELSAFADEVESRTQALTTANEELAHRALFDSLTGLPNRYLVRRRLEEALQAEAHGRKVAVLSIDLDGFKDVNDSLGHAAGDHVLAEVGARLLGAVRPGDTVGRVGGDEFAVVMRGASLRSTRSAAGRIADRLNGPTEIDGRPLRISASIGIAFAEAGDDLEDVFRHADVALYACKAARTGAPQVYTEELHEPILHRQRLTASLRGALDRQELSLVYQPIMEIGSRRIVGVEALARWTTPEFGNVSPAVFVPIAEQIGFMPQLGEWVLQKALSDARDWLGAGAPRERHLAVNLSAVQLEDAQFPRHLRQLLADAHVEPGQLVVEVTESQLVELMDETVEALKAIRESGTRIALDDFGTGYSSLSYLRALPVDVVKIDRAFISGIGSGSEEWAFAQAVVRLVQRLGLRTVAEGVEDAVQLAHARAIGCDMAQGFFVGRPESPAIGHEQLIGATVDADGRVYGAPRSRTA